MRRKNLFIMVMCISFLLSTLVGGYAAGPKPQYGGVLRSVQRMGPAGNIGLVTSGAGGGVLLRPVFEALLWEDYYGKFYPHLATTWKVSQDKKSITLTLRKGVKFHDGSELNAEAVRYNLLAHKEAKQAGTQNWTSIDIDDNYTVRINLNSYHNTMICDFASSIGMMISYEAVKKKGLEWANKNPTGTGPFKFVSFKRDVVTKYKKNENYWQKGKPYLDEIEQHVIKDPVTMRASFQAGEADVMGTDIAKMISELEALGYKILSAASGTVVLLPDSVHADSPFADKRVREALGYAIDRETIVKAKGYGLHNVAYQLAPKGTSAYIPDFKGREYNPEKAKKLLADAGYPNGFETKIIPMPFGIDRDVMVAIQSYLGQIGIKVDLDFVPFSKYTEYRYKGWHNAILCQPLGSFANFNKTLQWYLAEDTPQFPSLKRPKGYQDILNESLLTIAMDIPKIQKVIMKTFQEAMVIPIHDVGRAYITQKNVHNTGHMEYSVWPTWRPDNAWLSK